MLVRFHFSLPTFRFRLFIVRLADELSVFHEVELVTGVQLSGAKGARETG